MRKKKVAEHYNRISKYYDGFGFLKRLFELYMATENISRLKTNLSMR